MLHWILLWHNWISSSGCYTGYCYDITGYPLVDVTLDIVWHNWISSGGCYSGYCYGITGYLLVDVILLDIVVTKMDIIW